MPKILILDYETQGADAATTNITEVGAVLYDVSPEGKLTETHKQSVLCFEPEYPPQTEKIIEITGITDEMMRKDGIPRHIAMADTFDLMKLTDYVICHKVAFDRTVMMETCKRLGMTPPEKKWLCSLSDFPWPSKLTCHKLAHLAYELGVFVDPRTLHRALDDCRLLGRVIDEALDFNAVLAHALSPWVYLRADCLGPWKDGGEQTGIAKSLGFSWESVKGMDNPKFPKWWVMRCKEEKVAPIIEATMTGKSPFRVGRITGVC